jgi:hypothetical protein
VAFALIVVSRPAGAQIIGRAVSDQPDLFLSFNQLDRDYDVPGDMFGVRSRDFPDAPDCFECPGLPFSIVDETFDLFDPRPTDRQGIIKSEDFAPFFGVVDTVNDVRDDWNTAIWTFDITGFSDFRISADMAAMGDFEAGNFAAPSQDAFVFDYAVNSGPFELLFESSVDTQISQDYEMELPHADNPIITLDDPLSMNGVMLNNVFQNIAADISGSGSRLEIRFRAITDGGEEAFAFRNLFVEAIEQGGSVSGGGDYNQNGLVEQGDLDLVLLNWGSADVPVGWTFDLPDGNIDQSELDGVLLNWGNVAGRSTAAAVPEPSSLAIALPLVILLWHFLNGTWRRRFDHRHIRTSR